MEELEKYRRFLESQLKGAQAQIDDHPAWRDQGVVSTDHLCRWQGAKHAYEEALLLLESMFFYEP